jgi:hypothetical protein
LCCWPVPWHCCARCQHIGLKAAMALGPFVQRRKLPINLEDFSAARGALAKIPEGNHTGFFSRMYRIFLENGRRKIRRYEGKISLVILNARSSLWQCIKKSAEHRFLPLISSHLFQKLKIRVFLLELLSA